MRAEIIKSFRHSGSRLSRRGNISFLSKKNLEYIKIIFTNKLKAEIHLYASSNSLCVKRRRCQASMVGNYSPFVFSLNAMLMKLIRNVIGIFHASLRLKWYLHVLK
jgi:hypothetical protein